MLIQFEAFNWSAAIWVHLRWLGHWTYVRAYAYIHTIYTHTLVTLEICTCRHGSPHTQTPTYLLACLPTCLQPHRAGQIHVPGRWQEEAEEASDSDDN